MTTCERCGHGAKHSGWCAYPLCPETTPLPHLRMATAFNESNSVGDTRIVSEKFSRFLTPTGLWLWVLDTGGKQ